MENYGEAHENHKNSISLIEQSILAWFKNFENFHNSCNSISDLKNGCFLVELLVEIDPSYFIKTQKKMLHYADDNKALAYKNLKSLSEDLSKYYSEVLKIQLKKERKEIISFSKENDPTLLINLVELIIYIIVKSSSSEKYIEPITKTHENHQAILMELIKKLFKEFESSNHTNANEIDSFIKKEKKLLEKLDELEVENIQLQAKISDLSEGQMSHDKKINEINEILTSKNNEIKALMKEKDKLQMQIEINNLDDFQRNLQLKDKKIVELNKFIEDLTLTYEKKISTLEEELVQEKNYSAKLQKLEQSLDYYKTKYGDYSNVAEHNKELQKNNETLKSQIEEFQKRHELNELKISKYIDKLDQIQVEKLNLELEISKNNSELLRIKQEVSEFTEKLMKKDYKITELQNKLENFFSLENQKSSFFLESPKNLKNELNGFISEICETQTENNNISHLERFELQKDELLQKEKEIRHLMEKCKELQQENSDLRMKLELEIKNRHEKLNEEMKKMNNLNKNSYNELKKENKKIAEELLKMTEEKISLEEKINSLSKNEELMHDIEDENQFIRNNLAEKQKQVSSLLEKINSLEKINRKNNLNQKQDSQKQKEIDGLKYYIENMEMRFNKAIANKDLELELLITACHELRIMRGEGVQQDKNVLKDKNNLLKNSNLKYCDN